MRTQEIPSAIGKASQLQEAGFEAIALAQGGVQLSRPSGGEFAPSGSRTQRSRLAPGLASVALRVSAAPILVPFDVGCYWVCKNLFL